MSLAANTPSTLSRTGLWLGPLIGFLLIAFVDLKPDNPAVTRTAAVALWMAIWWITEAVPLAATALLPVALFPLLGIMNGKTVAPLYFNHIIFLFIGGFLVALAMQYWQLHKRIALRLLLLFGGCPRCTLTGFMIATAFLSMWISNTATTMMMVPIALAIVLKVEEQSDNQDTRFGTGIFLGVAYAASIGGLATLVGTPPNLSFARILTIHFPTAPEISFATWFAFAFPLSVILLIVAGITISYLYNIRGRGEKLDTQMVHTQYAELGPMSFAEKIVLANFISLAILWLTRKSITVGTWTLPGWSQLFENSTWINDGTVAIFIALLLFIIPSQSKSKSRILDWEIAANLPWHIILLFGGGFALASGFKESGLSLWCAQQLQGLGTIHPLILIVALCFLMTFLTELTSNTATAEMFLPILAALAVAVEVNPLLLMVPATLSCSCAFMLPVATPPNAIVFGTNRINMRDMARTGIILNLVGVVLVTATTWILGRVVLGIDLATMPDWAVLQ
ncbi:MAG: DASS family sodium-coupled anion symporter [Candidatus Latescibacteria bacterium]|nr:DASS family sodium-coupled anion symporter [Candidatus Latescibacterota bacterium]